MMFMHFALLMEMAETANCSLVFLFPFLHGDITFIWARVHPGNYCTF